jgi:hypothetical protein
VLEHRIVNWAFKEVAMALGFVAMLTLLDDLDDRVVPSCENTFI